MLVNRRVLSDRRSAGRIRYEAWRQVAELRGDGVVRVIVLQFELHWRSVDV